MRQLTTPGFMEPLPQRGGGVSWGAFPGNDMMARLKSGTSPMIAMPQQQPSNIMPGEGGGWDMFKNQGAMDGIMAAIGGKFGGGQQMQIAPILAILSKLFGGR